MAKQRIDNKPMNRVAQAAGDPNAVLLKQETDPTNMLELNRRHGSVRVDDKSKALGAVVDGKANDACWFNTLSLVESADWSIGFSLKVGQHLDSDASAKLPIITVQNNASNYWELYSVYDTTTTCKLKIGATLNGSSASQIGDAGRAKDSTVNVVLTFNSTTNKLQLNVSDDADVEEITVAPVTDAKFTVEILGNSVVSGNKISHIPHVVSNLTVYTGVLGSSAITAVYGNRTPATSNLQNHYLLSAGGQAVSSEVTNDTHMLLCDPSPPVAAADSIVFNGRSSALRVQMTPEIEEFFTTKGRSALFNDEYTFYLKGKRLQEDKAETLLDFDDLGVLAIDSDNHLTFTVSGTTHTFNDSDLNLANPDFEIFATKTSGKILFVIHDGAKETSSSTIASYLEPYFDMNNPPKLWVGAAAAESGTKYCGTITKFAMYKGVVNTDLGPSEDALVYMEGASFIDKTHHKTGLHGLAKTEKEAVCGYTSGPLDDANYVAVAGGHVLGEGDVVGLTKGTQRMAYAFKKDAEVLRIGSKLLVASNDVGHVIDEEAESVREYGVPSPWRNVSVKPTAPGVLEGAASYGYRYVTSDGTYGPIRRLDPAYIKSTAGRFIIGSSVGSESGEAEIGEEYIKSAKATDDNAKADSASTDIFGSVADDKRIVIETFAKVEELDMDEMPETIWGRGLQSVSSSDLRQYWKTGDFQLDMDSDFAVQVSFNYDEKTAYDRGTSFGYKGYMPAQGIFGIGNFNDVHRHSQWSRCSRRNPAICGYLIDGGDTHGGKWTHRTGKDNSTTTSSIYGAHTSSSSGVADSGTVGSPRLVIGIAREEYEHFHQHGSAGLRDGLWGPQSNFKWLTFTDATELSLTSNHSIWEDGDDYSLFLVREQDALKVYVHNATENRWHVLTGRTMDALEEGYAGHGGSTSGTYNGTDYFAGWSNPVGGTVQMVTKAIGDHTQFIPPIGTNGKVNNNVSWGYSWGADATYDKGTDLHQGEMADNAKRVMCNHEVYPMPAATVMFHARVWSDSKEENLLREEGYLRYSAQPGGALASANVIDGHFDWPDTAEEKDSFPDSATIGAGGLTWTSRLTRRGRVKAKVFEQEVAHAETKRQEILLLGNEGGSTTIANSPLALYYSNRGEGSITLQTMGAASYVISNAEIPGGGTDTHFALKADFDFVNDFHEWNMFTIQLRKREIGGATTLYIEGMAINGNSVFTEPISEAGAEWVEADGTDWITLAGPSDTTSPATNDLDCYIGEFRIWADGEGPKVDTGEPGPNGWHVNNRIPSDMRDKLLAYFTMTSGDNPASPGNTITNVGTASGSADIPTLTLDRADMLQDNLTGETGTNAVPFPVPPRPDLSAIELFRTVTQGIQDVDVEEDVQKALDNVRYAPLYFVARIGADTRHYIDDAPNAALGFAAPWTEYDIPDKIKQFFTWAGQVGVIGENNRVYYTEPGPFGWETFPHELVYETRVSGGGAGELLGCRSTGDTLYLFGQSWATALIGSPGNETEFPLGGGVGAYSARATIEMTGQVYAFNGRLWVMDRVGQVDFKVQDIGTAFQDLLPTHSNVRLACSTNLQSVFIIDENTGDTLRMFIPTGEVTVEKRYALAVGDSGDGTDQWVNLNGSYSTGNTTVYGDDVQTDTPSSNTGTISGAVFTTDGNLSTKVHVGMRIGIVDSAGSTQDTTITDVDATTIDVAAHDAIADGAATLYFGASSDGMIVDSGYIDSNNDNSMVAEAQISIQSGSGVEIGFAGSPMAGTRSSMADAQFVTVAANETTVGGNLRGRFLRGILRNRKPEATAISHVDIDITSPYD